MTVVITGVTYYQWDVSSDQLDEMKASTKLASDTLIASQRAWLAPQQITISGDFEAEKVTTFTVQYRNVGREPASEVRYDFASKFAPPNEAVNWPDFCALARIKIGPKLTSYPSENLSYNINLNSTPNATVREKVLNGQSVLYLSGCITYMTFGLPKESRYCFYWIHKQGFPMSQWEWRYCNEGNEAK